nr:EAL domain-containing protein [Neptunomonas japonica]
MQKTLLIVDDEPAILSSLKRMLYRAGYKTLLATSGAEALQVLQDNPDIRVVLSDFRMPVMTGGELLVEIKQRYPRVIGLILSGYADLDSVLEALNSGAVFKFLTKPWDENSLLDTVGLAFQRSVSEESESNIVLGVDQLLSRSKLLENLSTWMDSKAPVTVFYLDIKKFHTFNDSLGYEVADELLASVAHTLMQNIPDTGVLGQMSGDEFVLLLPHACSLEESQRLIGRFLQPFNELVSIAGRELHLSFSVGYGVAPQDGKTPELLVRNAQVAANRAKHLGPGCVLRYQITMNEKCRELVDLNSDLYRALEKDTLSVVYQPKVCLKTGNIVGAESLLRWNHHALGMVSPATFIPLAESSGLIEPIGEWVLSMASSQSKAWSLEGLPELLISVNVSGRQLQRNTLAKKLKIFYKYREPPPRCWNLKSPKLS